MNPQAAARILLDRLRRTPCCFAAQFSVTLWRDVEAEEIVELDAFVSYTGLHLHSAGDSQGLLASFTFDDSLVGWVSVNSMLVLTVVDSEDPSKKQLKNLHLRTNEATSMRMLLTSYAEVVAEEREHRQDPHQVRERVVVQHALAEHEEPLLEVVEPLHRRDLLARRLIQHGAARRHDADERGRARCGARGRCCQRAPRGSPDIRATKEVSPKGTLVTSDSETLRYRPF